jgi:hypothetical protein
VVLFPGRSEYYDSDQLAFLTVGDLRLPAKIYQPYRSGNYGSWTSGMRFEDPTTGRLRSTDDLPDDLVQAGAFGSRSPASGNISPTHPAMTLQQRRAEGRCIDCGGEIEPKGRYVRCASS